jgi:hypothetical protein
MNPQRRQPVGRGEDADVVCIADEEVRAEKDADCIQA